MFKLFFGLLISAPAFATPAQASTADVLSVETDSDPDQLTQDSRDQLKDMLVNRQPAILHPPIYEDEDPSVAVNSSPHEITDRIPERPVIEDDQR